MARGFRASVQIARPVEVVWDLLTDWSRAPEWMAGVEELRPPTHGPIVEGAPMRLRARGRERVATIIQWGPPHRLSLRSHQGGMTAVYTYTLDRSGVGARLTLEAVCAADSALWRPVAPLVALLMRRADAGQPAALQRLAEARPPRAAPTPDP